MCVAVCKATFGLWVLNAASSLLDKDSTYHGSAESHHPAMPILTISPTRTMVVIRERVMFDTTVKIVHTSNIHTCLCRDVYTHHTAIMTIEGKCL